MRDRRWDGPGFRHEPPAADDAAGWITGAVPDGWFTGAPRVVVDREEIAIVGRLPEPELPTDATPADRAAAEAGRINQYREETRDRRIAIARQVEHRYRRKVAWGVACGETEELFTNLSAPVMTRLRQPERQVLDTLVDAGVARSRSEALAWCVRLVGEHAEQWLGELRTAMGTVEELRRRGPA
ncbi:hypothetical protein [Plantactinospora sp. KBS50]|uniref:hypothetical protein n=1 Tax=Plantactinospora sp. KBS50 TaxID=2024580 RepID=UPI000BAB14BE|nr:hypothetical protein [Plantactinospora sp. KBS50]ASW53933.1 hypothetical protein CIK06_06675 [Plantactinospora sp. KBS50]